MKHVCAYVHMCVCVCVCVSIYTRPLLSTRLTRRSGDPAGTSVYPKSWPPCTDTFTADINTTHTHTHTRAHTHASATVQVTQSLLSSILSIGCHLPHVLSPNQSEPTSLMTERIFLHQALVVERPPVKKKNCVRLGVGSYWVAVHAHVCGLKLDRSKKPVLICPKECSWRGANSQWLQLVVAERERQREKEGEHSVLFGWLWKGPIILHADRTFVKLEWCNCPKSSLSRCLARVTPMYFSLEKSFWTFRQPESHVTQEKHFVRPCTYVQV